MEKETNNQYAPGEQPGNHRNGQYVLIAIGLLLGLAVWKDRINYQPVVYVEQLPATDDGHGDILYDSRGVPYYYAYDPAMDTAHPMFYFDTPIDLLSDRATP